MIGSAVRSGRACFAVALIGMAALVTSCAPSAEGAAAVSVTLADDALDLGRTRVPPGSVAFEIHNEGTLVHEFEVFAGADERSAPAVANSVADTTGLELVDEVEDILVASSASLVVDLAPGTYLLVCNLPDHYGNGMYAFLTVAADG